MIVLPLIEEARSGRRPPWLTLALVLACVVSFLVHRGSDRQADERTDAALEAAWTYFSTHPYVEVDADLLEMFDPEQAQAATETFLDQLRSSGSPGIPDFVRRHDQVEFDRRAEAVYQAMEGHSFFRFGFFPEAMSKPDASFLTYVFVHEDWLHLVSNLVLILLAGLFLEEVWGHGLFLTFMVTGAIAGAVGYATLDPEAGDALGGASGLAAAMAGAFLVRFALVPIRFQYFVIPPFGGKFTARGWITLPIYGGLYAVIHYVITNGAPGIEPMDTELATWAHVGGLVWGVAFASAMKLLKVEERFIRPKIEKKMTTRSNPMLDRALEAREAGHTEEAFELLARVVSRHPGDRDAALAFWDAASAVGRPAQAAEALAHTLREEVGSGHNELAIQHWRELAQRVPEFPLEASLEVRIVGLLIEADEDDLAEFSIRRVLEGSCDAVTGATAHKLALLTRELDAGLALGAARRALAANDLEPAETKEVERLAQELERAIERRGQSAPEITASGYDSDELDLSPEDGADDDGLDPDGDTLNAEPFELDDLTAPPGVRTLDLEADAPDVVTASTADRGSVTGSEPLPGVAEIPLEERTAPPIEASTAPPSDGSTAPSLDGATTSPFGGPTMSPLGETTAPALDPSELPALDEDDLSLDEAPLDAFAPEPDASELDRSAPDLSLGSDDVGPVVPVVSDSPPGSGTGSAAASDPGHSLPGLGDEDLDLGASLPGLGDDAAGLDHGLIDLDESTPDLGLSMPPGPGPAPSAEADEEIPLADASVRTHRPVSLDDTGAPDLGNTIDLSSLGAQTIPGYGDDDGPRLRPPEASASVATRPPGTTSSGPAPTAPELEAPRPRRTLKRMEAIPLALGDEGVTLDVGERGKAQLAFERIDAISAVGVRGLRPKPVVVIDLVTNWHGTDRQPLKIVRLRSDRFDPVKLVPGESNGFRALKQWISRLIEKSGALPLPDANSAVGTPFQIFDDLAAYEREVLRVL